MSFQTEIDGEIKLNPMGVVIIETLHEERKKEPIDYDRETWSVVADKYPLIRAYGDHLRADFIPYGCYADITPESTLLGNLWSFQCSTANKGGELEAFIAMLHLISDEVYLTTTDDDGWVDSYAIEGGAVLSTHRYNKYQTYGRGF